MSDSTQNANQHKDINPPKPNDTKLMMVPDDILEKVMSFISYDEVSRCRLVCRRFNAVSQRVLNRGFHKVERYHAQCLKKVKSQLPRRESERRKHHLARHSDILTAVETRLSLLGMTFMKYIDANSCCFIPGKVLDEIYRVLRYVTTEASPVRAHEVLQELRDLSSMAMEYFDEKILPTLKKHKDPVPKIIAGISFQTNMKPCSRSCSSTSSCSEEISKFAKMSHYIRQILAKQNQANKELLALQAKNAEVTKKCRELDKQIMEQQKIIESQDVKIKEHEKQLVAVSKHMRINLPPTETNECVQYVKVEPQLLHSVKREPEDPEGKSNSFICARDPRPVKIMRLCSDDNRCLCAQERGQSGSPTEPETVASTSDVVQDVKPILNMDCATQTPSSSRKRSHKGSCATVQVNDEGNTHRPITRSCTSRRGRQGSKRKFSP